MHGKRSALVCAILVLASHAAGQAPVSRPFGTLPDGRPVWLHVLERAGLRAEISELGGTVTRLWVPDREGRTADVVLGFDDLAAYLEPQPYLGALIGRYANRIGGARFALDGVVHRLVANEGPHQLHGGAGGFHAALWKASTEGPVLVLSLRSPAGDQGFPGALDVTVRYAITDDAGLRIDYRATSDAPTVVNLTHHGYFNLAGHDAGDVRSHRLAIRAERFTPVGPDRIPTGELAAVGGTTLDFRREATIGARGGAFDHNFVLDDPGTGVRLVARASEPVSGRVMEVLTDQPGLQLFTAGGFDGSLVGKGGARYGRFAGLCLETQHFPDAPNQPAFPSTVLRPGEAFTSTTIYRFRSGDGVQNSVVVPTTEF